jgi:hypothetical protein
LSDAALQEGVRIGEKDTERTVWSICCDRNADFKEG